MAENKQVVHIFRGGVRLLSLDVLKCFAIYLVVCGHIIQQFDPLYKQNLLFTTIYSFHMPLFMLISGYLFASKLDNINNDRYIAFNIVQSRFLQILMPYIVWTLLVISYKTLISGFSIISLSEFSTNLWFLKCLFLCILVSVCGRLLFNNTFIFVVLTLLLTHGKHSI